MKLKDLCKIKHGFAFKGKHIVKDCSTKYVLVTPGNFNIGGGFKSEKYKYFSESGEIPKDYILHEDDLIITMTDLSVKSDTLGYSALVPYDQNHIYLHNQRIGLVYDIDESKVLKKYLYWFMRTKKYHQKVVSSQSGTAIHHTSPNRILDIDIGLPSINVQSKIIKVLENIDSKIKTNNHINDNLFDIIKSIHKQYFLTNNKYPIKTISELKLDISDGNYSSKYPTKSEFLPEGVPFIRGTDFKNNTINKSSMVYISEKKHSELKKGHLKENDILITTRGEIGMIAFVPKSLVDSNINAQLVRINGGEKYPKSFLGVSLLSKTVQDDIKSLTTGSALQQLPIGKLQSIKLTVPDDLSIILEYDKMVSPLLEKMEENYEENNNLEQLRDTLLPKLMNGEINLENIEI